MVMKRVSIQVLKAGLSALITEAEEGRTIVVTRHNAPVAQLGPARMAHGPRGAKRTRLKPAITRGTKGRYLRVLAEDRGER
jgi:prevent-host-death family protein